MSVQKVPLKDLAYEKIKNDIIKGKLNSNQILKENEIADSLGISRTPVREAFQRLEREGFIHLIPYKGAMVNKLDLNDIKELSQAREALEGMAARLACGRIKIEKLLKIEELFRSVDNLDTIENQEKCYKLGRLLHDEILKACGNKIIVNYVKTLLSQFERVMLMSRRAKGRAEEAYNEHLEIIKAIKKNDPDLAEKKMREHINKVVNDAIRVNY